MTISKATTPRDYRHAIFLLETEQITTYEFILAADQLFPHRSDDARKLTQWDGSTN